MKSLLHDQFVPITQQIGFLEGSFDNVAQAYLTWRQSLQPELEFEYCETNLPHALQKLDPLTTPWDRELLIETQSRWIAFFCNGLHACDPESPIGHLCTIVPCRGIVVHCVPDRSAVQHPNALRIYGTVSFTLFSSKQTAWLNQERYIRAMNDGGEWVFFCEGQEQSFEQPEKYKARRIVDRLTCEMLEEYCASYGIHLFNEDFYRGRNLITRIPNQTATLSPTMALKEARRLTLAGVVDATK